MPPRREENTVTIENCRLIFRNFAGREGPYNREGDRNFAVPLEQELADRLTKDGWLIKILKPREDDEEQVGQPYIPVTVKYGKGRPPQIVLVTSRNRVHLNEDDIEMLDYADIESVDLIIRPYEWTVNGNSGIKAYLKKMFVTIHEDDLDRKYADLHDVPSSAGRIED